MTQPNITEMMRGWMQNLQALDILKLHQKADTDSAPNAAHHTLGSQGYQSSPGDHVHDGRTSRKLYPNPVVITGSKGGNIALTNLLIALDQAGIIQDSTS